MQVKNYIFIALFSCSTISLLSMNDFPKIPEKQLQEIIKNPENFSNITFLEIPKKKPQPLSLIKKQHKCTDCKEYKNFIKKLKLLLEPEVIEINDTHLKSELRTGTTVKYKKITVIQELLKEYNLDSDCESDDDKE